MKKIQKKISLEQFKSRMPSIIDAYYKGEEWIYGKGLSVNQSPYTNYGMIPKSIKLNGKVISYNTLVGWYHFLERYMGILTVDVKCGDYTYESVVDIYNSGYNIGLTLAECQEMDSKFGEIKSYFTEHENSDCMTLYNHLTKTFFPKFIFLDEQQRMAWNKSHLSIHEVHQWIGWFKERKERLDYENKTADEVSDCCDYEKYHLLGGGQMYEDLKTFLKSISKWDIYEEPYAEIPIILSTSIDDMGEFSIFSEEWDAEDYTDGTVVNYNGEAYIRESDKLNESSFIYNEYKELEFNPNGWARYTNTTEISEPLELIYTYNHEGKFRSGDDINLKNMSKVYPMYSNGNLGYIVFHGTPYPIKELDVIEIQGVASEIHYDMEGNPFVKIGKKTYYGVYGEGVYTFKFKDAKYTIEKGNFVKINHSLYKVENSQTTINGILYNSIFKYAIVEGVNVYFNNDNKTCVPLLQDSELSYVDSELSYVETEEIFGEKENENVVYSHLQNDLTACYLVEEDVLYVHTPNYTLYNSQYIKGETESKLSSFISSNLAVDNVGNQLYGIIGKYADWLELPIQPQTFIHITREETNENATQTIWCDYLEKIVFHYSDLFGNVLVSMDMSDNNFQIDTVESALQENLTDYIEKNDYSVIEHPINPNLLCTVTYHMGCVIDTIISDETVTNTIIDSGVTYVETIELQKKQCQFFVSNMSFKMINYYQMIFNEKKYIDETYGNEVTIPMASFSYKLRNNDEEFSHFPLMREEYKIGSSSYEKVDADIYINRGTARSFDNHIKLLEINSLESLEQYGNGYFKIINN